MKAMVLAAGRGTRLHPYTLEKPKALVEIGGKPLLAIVLEKLIAAGFGTIVVNVHHFAEMIVDYLRENPVEATVLISDERDRLLDTGGAIIKAKQLLNGDEPFLVHNVDILSDINLRHLIDNHAKTDSIATLAVGKRASSRQFLFDGAMRLCGWRNNITNKEIVPVKDVPPLEGYAFAGIHVVSPEIFRLITKIGPFSIVEGYLSLCASWPIYGLDTSANHVLDVGKPQNLEKAADFFTKEGFLL